MNITALEFGIYRDGDNNLDLVQSPVIDQAFDTSAHNELIAFTVEDTTARSDFAHRHGARTESYEIRDGQLDGSVREDAPHDPSSRQNLARFVAHTLDEAQRNGAKKTWIDLVDHGGGDGGGLESDTAHSVMSSDNMAGAIADGIALHAQQHPEDAARRIDGVVANQCLMATLGFADALSKTGVKWLAASPETMLAPGVPSTVADPIARLDGKSMADDVVRETMSHEYRMGRTPYTPAAAFDVIDLDPKKIATMRKAVKELDHALAWSATHNDGARNAILEDAASVDGMTRFTDDPLPWHADRPAMKLYDTIKDDMRLSPRLRQDAAEAAKAVHGLVAAHGESAGYAPFGGAEYCDAIGPTVHFATTPAERDPWAPSISETHTAFYKEVGADKLDRALLA